MTGVPQSSDSGRTTGNGSSHSIGSSSAAAEPSSVVLLAIVDRPDDR